MKKNIILLIILSLVTLLYGCEKPEESGGKQEMETNCTVIGTKYEGVSTLDDIDAYHSDVGTNLPDENGIINCPYYTLDINGVEIPVYSTRTAHDVHSFAYIDVGVLDKTKDFVLNVTLTILKKSTVLFKKEPNVIVLPEKHGVVAELKDREVTATITKFGSFSFVFNRKSEEAITLMVTEKENTEELFKNKEIKYIEPGDYSTDRKMETIFEEQNKVYYFKAGRYQVDRILVPSNSVLYLERGAYLEVIPTTNAAFIQSVGEENIKVAGRGLIDYSACCGGEVPEGYHSDKGGLVFNNVVNMEFSGITVINSQTWTLCLNACQDIRVFNVLFLGYRVYSDGIMLSDCKNAIVEYNFIRTGDDAFETKSTTHNGLTENVLFRHNDAWTDKGVAYGCIYESNHDTSDVRFEDCTVGFALGSWSNHLGSCVIQMGDRKGARMYNIHFNNIEIFTSHNAGILNIFIGGSGGRGEGYGHVDDIHFSNISVVRNYGAFLNLRTYDSVNCSIKRVYVNNIVSNGVLLTPENYQEEGYINDFVVGGYDFRYLQINNK